MSGTAMFGKYRLVRPLAEGGMAQVYIAKQVGLEGFEKPCVLKRILPQHSKNPDFVEMFLDEARISARLAHPNLVQIFDFGLQEGCYFLAMEYLPGENLRSMARMVKLRQEHVPSEIAATIVANAAAGLHYAHTLKDDKGKSLGIVHRDVSPANVMVTLQGSVKVLDFGIARAEGKLAETQTGVVKGKWAYMAPEQVRSLPLDGRTDVFALGIVLHELLTGTKLFQRDNELAMVAAVITDPIPTPRSLRPTMPPEIDQIVMKALERDVSKRYQSAEELQHALNEFIAHRTFVNPAESLQKYLVHVFGETHIAELKQLPQTDPSAVNEVLDKTQAEGPVALATEEREEKKLRPQGVPLDDDQRATTAWRVSNEGRRNLAPAIALALAMVTAGSAAAWYLGRPAPPPPPQPIVAVVPPVARVEPSPRPEAPKPVEEKTPEPAPPVAATEPAEEGPKKKPKAKPPPKQFGILQVNCVPWCRVYLDGVDTGKNSPVSDLRVAAGRHKLKVVNPPTGSERERDIEIPADGVRREVIKF